MATPAAILETVEYRVVLVQRDSPTVLAFGVLGRYCLPRVRIPQLTRPAQRLRMVIEATWGLDVFVLDVIVPDHRTAPCMVAELLMPRKSSDFKKVKLDQISRLELSEQERFEIVLLLDGKSKSPLSRIGWINDATTWIESATGRAFSSKTNIEQLNAGQGFALLGFSSDDGKHYWLKATGEPNTHEVSITLCLSKMCGEYLPEYIASKQEWNAWLMSGDSVRLPEWPLKPLALCHLLEDAVASMAEVQMKSAGRELELLEAGAFDQRLNGLSTHAGALFEYLEEAMSQQTSTKKARIERGRIHELRAIFERICARLEKLALPNSVLHGDMNFSNILMASQRCQFIDWCEAYVGNPLITLQHLLLLNRVGDVEFKSFIERSLKDKYRIAMSQLCDPAFIDIGFIYMPFLAACSTLYGRGDWLTRSFCDEPHRSSYARTLGHYIDQAAREPVLLEALGI
jgi:hypothetical protein